MVTLFSLKQLLIVLYGTLVSAASLQSRNDEPQGPLLAPSLRLDLANSSVVDLSDIRAVFVPNPNYQGPSNPLLRTDVRACLKNFETGNDFRSLADATPPWLDGLRLISYSIKDQSNYNYCGRVGHKLGRLNYRYHASGACGTTALQSTIQGALDKAFKQIILKGYNSFYCIELTHGGAWHGYLLVGPQAGFPENYQCGANNAGQCVSGGNNDVV